MRSEEQLRQTRDAAHDGGRFADEARRDHGACAALRRRGHAHLPPSVGTLRGNLHANTGVFNRFLTMTDAKLILPNGSAIEAPVMLINRDLIAAISSPAESNALAKIG